MRGRGLVLDLGLVVLRRLGPWLGRARLVHAKGAEFAKGAKKGERIEERMGRRTGVARWAWKSPCRRSRRAWGERGRWRRRA